MGTVLSYTKVVRKRKEVQKVEGGSKFQALSQAIQGSTARIVVNDKDILENAPLGWNVAVFAGQNHELISVNTYKVLDD